MVQLTPVYNKQTHTVEIIIPNYNPNHYLSNINLKPLSFISVIDILKQISFILYNLNKCGFYHGNVSLDTILFQNKKVKLSEPCLYLLTKQKRNDSDIYNLGVVLEKILSVKNVSNREYYDFLISLKKKMKNEDNSKNKILIEEILLELDYYMNIGYENNEDRFYRSLLDESDSLLLMLIEHTQLLKRYSLSLFLYKNMSIFYYSYYYCYYLNRYAESTNTAI